MWNRWTSSLLLACALLVGTDAVSQPERRGYAWMVLRGDDASYEEAPPAGKDWDAAVLVAPIPPFGAPAEGLLELTGGDTIPGELIDVRHSPGGDRVVWRSPRLGEFNVPLATVSSLRLRGGVAPELPGAILRNGDMIEGRVEISKVGLSRDGVLGGASVPWERVSSVRLLERTEPRSAMRVWLRNGGGVRITSVSHRDGGVVIQTADGRSGLYHAGEVLAVTRGALHVRPMPAPDERGETVTLDGDRLTVRAPGVAVWKLPPGARAILGSARTPEDSTAWGDALLSVWSDSTLIMNARTKHDRPAVALGAPLPHGPRTLTLSVQPGTAGTANGVMRISLALIEEYKR